MTSIGSGAMIRTGEEVGYEGALYTLQQQAGLPVHIGGKTALALQGRAHYLDLNVQQLFLFCDSYTTLPNWFLNHDWGYGITPIHTSFLPYDIGLTSIPHKTFSLKVSNPERAMLECLYMTPKVLSLMECYELMEGMNNFRPKQVQLLLEKCSSVKVKRLFLYMAEKASHRWLDYVDTEQVDLGSGKRAFAKGGGVYNSKYKITVPKELEN